MKQVTLYDAKTHLSALLTEAEAGEEVVITRHGRPVARLVGLAPCIERVPGDLRALPGWADFTYDPAIFAPMTEAELRAEGWDG